MVISIKTRKGMSEFYTPRTRKRTNLNKLSTSNNLEGSQVKTSSTIRISEPVYAHSYTAMTTINPSTKAATMKDIRFREKSEMQDLNTRLAHCIEISRYEEALNKRLKEAIERLRNSPIKDADAIKKMYEIEMKQLRDLLEDAENEKNKEKDEHEYNQGLYNDLNERLQDLEFNEEDNRKIIRQQYENLADYEAKIARLEREIDLANDDKNRNKGVIDRLRMALNNIKNTITAETMARIESQHEYQILKDKLDSLREANEKELSEINLVPYNDKINQSRTWWSDEFSKCIKDIQGDYENRLASIRNELQSSYTCKIHEIQTSAALTLNESEMMKNKCTVLKDSSNKLKSTLTDTKHENLLLSSQNEQMEQELNELRMQYDELLHEKENDITHIKEQLERTLSELQNITDNNNTLELEILSYRKLLEDEENRMGIKQESYHQNLNSMMIKGEVEKQTTYQKTNKGPVAISEVAADGSYIELENTSISRPEILQRWRIIQNVDNSDFLEYEIDDSVLNPKEKIKIWANGMGKPDVNDLVWINKSHLGVGNNVLTNLVDSRGDVKATYTLKTIYNI